jgi:ribulose-5-phosphate 4-epimerase/fuculose-1-phosphate aldolase
MDTLERNEAPVGHLTIPSRKNDVSPEEWQTRVDLAALYRLSALFGYSDLIFTHLTARVPGVHDEFLINPYGVTFDEVTASSLIKIDLAGNKLEDSPFPLNPSGFTIHSAVHAARPDIQCVAHTHSLNVGAVSAQKCGLLPVVQQSTFVLASLAYHDYDGVTLDKEQQPALIRDIGDKHFVMLRNHGLLVLGPTIPDSFVMIYTFEAACIAQLRAQAGGELIMIPQQYVDTALETVQRQTLSLGGGLAWPGLLRKLDRMDPSYRT